MVLDILTVRTDTSHRSSRMYRLLSMGELQIKLGLRNNKKMYFHIPRMEEFSFDDDRSVVPNNLVSVISAKKMLRRGCQGYMALVRYTYC